MPLNLTQSAGRLAELSFRSSHFTELKRVLGVIFWSGLLFGFVSIHGAIVPPGQSVTLTWISSPDTNVAGYNIYYGVASHTYPDMINAGNTASTTISGLVPGVTYYIAATAYDFLGNQSDFSNEAIYTVPALSEVRIRSAYGGLFTLTVTGKGGHTYDIEATQDFTTWIVIGMVTLDASGSVDFTDMNAANFPQRFYRTEEVP